MRFNRHRRSLFATSAFAVVLALAASAPTSAQKREDDGGRASKNGLAEGKVGDADVKITYGRPKVKGRTIWGNLVPYGKVWRAGADEATTVTFSKDVEVEGQAVPAGTYALFFIPEENEWTLVLNKVPQQWGAFRYDEKQDLVRVKVKPTTSDAAVEELTYEVAGDKIVLKWEKVAVPVTVTS